MKRTTLFLCTLASASAALLIPSLSGEKLQIREPAASDTVLVKFHAAVQAQVLQHLNPKESLADRFSRRLRPMPSQYYDTEIVGTDKAGVVTFSVMHNDRSNLVRPTRKLFTTGKFISRTGELFLLDASSGKHVPALEHPSIKKGATG